jgi:GT2 family glycosyltransferase
MLSSLALQTRLPDEIIIVDSSTIPIETIPELAELWQSAAFDNARRIYMHTEPGLTFQRNQGIKQAQGDVIYFFDDDVVLSERYLEHMHSVFENNPHYLGGMGNIVPLSCYKYYVNLMRGLFFCQRNYSSGRFTVSGMPTHSLGNEKFSKVQVLSGCCMAFRSSVFKRHLFDEKLRFYGYMEDCDFSYRVSRDGLLFYNPQAHLQHNESPLNRDKIIDNKAMFIANYSYLFFKNFYPHNRFKFIAYLWTVFGLFLEALVVTCDRNWVQGYCKGLRHVLRHKGKMPYVPY